MIDLRHNGGSAIEVSERRRPTRPLRPAGLPCLLLLAVLLAAAPAARVASATAVEDIPVREVPISVDGSREAQDEDAAEEAAPTEDAAPADESDDPGSEAASPQSEEADEEADGEDGDSEQEEDADDEDEAPKRPRITFRVPFTDEKGGGVATGSAGLIEQRANSVVASGDVMLKFRDMEINAEEIEVESDTKRVRASGNVIIDQGPKRLSSDSVDFDLETETGTFYGARAFVDPDIYFLGEEIEKVGENSYRVKKGIFTSCEDDVPEWSFKVARADIDVGGYARARHTTMRVKRLPFLYVPYILWPAKQGRVSGLLVPNIGYSEQRGATVGLAYFQTLGRSYDTTFYADVYGEDYYGFGNEFRYRPSEATRGIFEGYVIDGPIIPPDAVVDPEAAPTGDETRWKVSLNHESDDLPFGMRGVLNYKDYSDFNFFRDFERDFGKVTVRSLQSQGFIAGNWGQHSFTLLVEDRENFFSFGRLNQRQLPEAEYRLRSTQLGNLPLYLELLGAGHYFEVAPEGSETTRYGRADLFPQLTVPLSTLPWLSASVTGGARATWYGETTSEDGTQFTGESLNRFYTTGQAELVGPSFSRIFETPVSFFEKFKHVVEPRWVVNYAGDFEDLEELVPQFDEVDRRPVNIAGFSLVNRVLGKPADTDTHGDTREILSFELGQAYSLDDDIPLQSSRDGLTTSQRGPISGQLRFNPSFNLSVDGRVNYSTLFSGISSASTSGQLNFGKDHQNGFGLTWFLSRDAELGTTTREQIRAFAGVDLVPERLRIESQINYNVRLSNLQQQRHFLIYTGSCYGLRFEFTEFQTNDRRDTDFRFAVSLKNVGTFLDLTSGQSEGF